MYTLLEKFYKNHSDLFIALFVNNYVLPEEILAPEFVDAFLAEGWIELDRATTNIKATTKINHTNGQFLFTDFIHQTVDRVFPFTDEGDILIEKFETIKDAFVGRKGLAMWDMTTGCGHPLIAAKAKFETIVEKVTAVGTDISERAIDFATRNIELNNSGATVELSDFGSSLPADRQFNYIWANPPFGLSPQNDSLHTFGGRYGMAKTIEVLENVAGRLAEGGVAQVLTYSICKDGYYFIEEHLNNILPDGWNFEIELLKDKKLWRFNGTKGSNNPMPIEQIAMRAADPFYNLKAIPKAEWLGLANEIKEHGATHLAYILVTIRA